MKLLNYKDFVNENISTNVQDLIKSIDGVEVDPFYEIGLDKDKYSGKDIDFLYNDSDFNRKLYDKKFKKGDLISTLDTEHFIGGGVDLKYFFLFSRNKSKIDDPDYITIQYNDDNWSKMYMFKVEGSVRNFLEKLTAKTVEIEYKGDTYIYQTSNSGNNWTLQNIEMENDKFKEDMENEDLRDLLSDPEVKLNVIE